METNTCDVNNLDADVLLPPRKRLLAGLKRQNSDVNPQTSTTPNNGGSEFDARFNHLWKSQISNPNLSNEEIIEASRLAAAEAAKVAKAARATAEATATKAAKAVAAAKSALELVASVEEIVNGERYLKKNNKMKRHVQVETLYNKPRGTQNSKTDEELARKLHRAINSSPRISKNFTSESKPHKHKKLKSSSSFEKAAVNYVGTVLHGNQSSASNGNSLAGSIAHDDSVPNSYMARVDLNIPKFSKADGQKMESGEMLKHNKSNLVIKENGEADFTQSGEKVGEDDDDSVLAKKRGRIKQKKLPLSICSIKDLAANTKEDLHSKTLPANDNDRNKVNGISKAMFSVGPAGESGGVPVERTSLWKCQAFKAPTCVKQNKVMQS